MEVIFPASQKCLDENVLVDFVSGRSSEEGRQRVETHVDQCVDCRQIVALMVQATTPGQRPVTPSSPSEGLAPGTLLGDRFRLRGLVGRGGMGMVYEADDQLLRTRVAVKLLLPEVASAPQLLEQLHREILVGRRIGHPNVCRLYDLGKSGDLHFISMEFVEGETLESCLRRGPLPTERALEILEQICAALAAAHAEGVVHRDLKPANVMIDEQGRIKVMDFGLARDLHAEGSLFSRPVGTPAYWSPEQARGEAATVASDLYALGRTALQIFGGLHAARGKRELVSVPEPYRKAIARCLELAPEDRWPSAEALRHELSRRRPSWIPRAIAGVVFIGALGGAGVFLAQQDSAEHVPIAAAAPTVRASRPVRVVEEHYAQLMASSRARFIAIGTLGRIEQRLRLAERALRDGDAPGADERLGEVDRILAEEP